MPDAGVYGAGFAGLYDLFHASKQYRDEARFIRAQTDALLGAHGRKLRLLDLACGTGSHAIEFSRLKLEVTGIDRSEEMLQQARRKARTAKRSIRFECQDLTKLSFPDERWDVATCLFDSLGYLRTDRRIGSALKRMAKQLAPGGLLFAEVWHAPAMLSGFDPLRVRRVRGAGLEAVRIGETRLLPERNAAEVRYEIFSRKVNGPWRHFFETHVNRFFTASEIEALIATTGFRVVKTLGGFSDPCPPSDRAWHLLVIAERLEGS
jgi:ubiquinone/menaquinone biosynthesis C-methylase UbiE